MGEEERMAEHLAKMVQDSSLKTNKLLCLARQNYRG